MLKEAEQVSGPCNHVVCHSHNDGDACPICVWGGCLETLLGTGLMKF
jgi:hypothetical protein